MAPPDWTACRSAAIRFAVRPHLGNRPATSTYLTADKYAALKRTVAGHQRTVAVLLLAIVLGFPG